MGWNRRFAHRSEKVDHNAAGGAPQPPIPTISKSLDRQQSRLDLASNTIPPPPARLNPNMDKVPLEEGHNLSIKKQVLLQKQICIFICTVLPMLTISSILFRLWYAGVL